MKTKQYNLYADADLRVKISFTIKWSNVKLTEKKRKKKKQMKKSIENQIKL